jgi:hypothetical protein
MDDTDPSAPLMSDELSSTPPPGRGARPPRAALGALGLVVAVALAVALAVRLDPAKPGDGRSWRRIPTSGSLNHVGDMAFARDGTLLAADWRRKRLLRARPGSDVLRPLRGGPRADRITSSGGVLVAFAWRQDTVAVSLDGRRWRTVTPTRAVLRPVH